MNYFIFIVVALTGIALGMYLAWRGKSDLISEQEEKSAPLRTRLRTGTAGID